MSRAKETPPQSRRQRERDLRREIREHGLEEGIVMEDAFTEDRPGGWTPVLVGVWLIMFGFVVGVLILGAT